MGLNFSYSPSHLASECHPRKPVILFLRETFNHTLLASARQLDGCISGMMNPIPGSKEVVLMLPVSVISKEESTEKLEEEH